MITASQLRPGMAIRYQGSLYKIVSSEYHAGQGKMGGVTHTRLRNIETGTFWEHGFRAEEKLEEAPLEKQSMDFLYSDSEDLYFMNPETFDQVTIPRVAVGAAEKFLRPDMRVPVEFFDGRPISVVLPDIVEARVESTAEPTHTQGDNTWKPARLENEMEVMVPQFIRSGETIRLDVHSGKYVERAHEAKK
jgi:elongation factor P